MATKKSKGTLLDQGQKTSARSSLRFRSKLFKMRLVETQPTLFGDYSPSDQWGLLLNAMENDVNKEQEFKFRHPQHKDKVFVRHYIGSPEYGFALLTLGQFRNPLDFVFVRIVPKSLNYGEPYLVFVKLAQSFRNPHILAEMVESAFNWVLKDTGVKLVLEPWETDEKIMWYKDYSESFMAEVIRCKGEGLTMVGYEDALEYLREKEAREDKKPKISKKSDDIMDYIEHSNKEAIIKFLRQSVKNMRLPKDIARPVRLLCDYKLVKDKDEYRLPYKAFLKTCPEIKELISERKYNNWTNKYSTNYNHDNAYKKLEKVLAGIL